MKNIILASQSPRRRELLTQIGLEFEVHPAGGEEIITSTDPVEVVKSLSTQKAAAVKEELEPQLPENWLVIGAGLCVGILQAAQGSGTVSKPGGTDPAFFIYGDYERVSYC